MLEPPPSTPAGYNKIGEEPSSSRISGPNEQEGGEDEEEEEDLTEMQTRLQALRS